MVGTIAGGWEGRDVEEGIFVEGVDSFEGGGDGAEFGVFFRIEEVYLVGVWVVE